MPLWSADMQEAGQKEADSMAIGEAIEKKMIKNETLAYFMVRAWNFLTACGINADAIRFRQHRAKEMAHYAQDCWDAEVQTSYGWIEVGGHADRSAFDLTRHQKATKVELMAARALPEPRHEKVINCILDKKIGGKEFKRDWKAVCDFFDALSVEDKRPMKVKFEEDDKIVINVEGKDITLEKRHISFSEETKIQHEEKYIPYVIEPSYGIGRIVYCIFEHCFNVRAEDAQRTYFTFPPLIAPVKCSILPLINNEGLNVKTQELKKMLIRAGVSNKVDDSGVSVGKRYARTDECGIPFALTVDFETLEGKTKDTVTMRDLDSMKQIRLPIEEVSDIILDLSANRISWNDCVDKYGLFVHEVKEEEEK
jgi:glycyl-tRNA synthetase